jgi:hypothetical protein
MRCNSNKVSALFCRRSWSRWCNRSDAADRHQPGDVVADLHGDVFGDGVNVAARLQPLAEPGGISGKTFEELRGRVSYPFEDVGEHSLKNIPWRVPVFTLAPVAVRSLAQPEAEPPAERRRLRPILALCLALIIVPPSASVLIWRQFAAPIHSRHSHQAAVHEPQTSGHSDDPL